MASPRASGTSLGLVMPVGGEGEEGGGPWVSGTYLGLVMTLRGESMGLGDLSRPRYDIKRRRRKEGPLFSSLMHENTDEAKTALLFSSPLSHPLGRLEAKSLSSSPLLRIILMLKLGAARERLSQKPDRRGERTRHTKYTCIKHSRNYTRVFSELLSSHPFAGGPLFSESESSGLGEPSQDPRTKRQHLFPSGISTILGG